MCACVVLGLVFPCQAKWLAWGKPPKWPIMCGVERKTLTQAVRVSCPPVCRVDTTMAISVFDGHFLDDLGLPFLPCFSSCICCARVSLGISVTRFYGLYGLLSSNQWRCSIFQDKRDRYLPTLIFHLLQLGQDSPSVLWHCWLGVSKSTRPVETEWWGDGVVICLEWGATDLHMVQLMPLPPHHLLLHYSPEWFNLSGAGLHSLSWKRGHLVGVVVCCCSASRGVW